MATTATPRSVARAMSEMGGDVRTWRRLRRLTIDQVADRAGVDRKTVMSLEAGRNPTLESLLRVARALGVMDELAGSLDPYNTDVGRLRADEALPKRVRSPRIEPG